jgi:hypothetical protein
MEFRTAMTRVTNWDVLQWNQISAIKRSISGAKHQEFAFQLHGDVIPRTIAMITQMSRIAARSHARITSTSAKMANASTKLMFAMEMTIVAMEVMSLMSMLAFHRHSDVQLVNGLVRMFSNVASI